jgi:hypothetical protein
MKQVLVMAVAVLASIAASGQSSTLHLHGGFTNYVGDMNDKYLNLQQAGKGLGLSYHQQLKDKLWLKAGFFYGSITSSDKQHTKPVVAARNLTFQNNIIEGSAMLEYNLFGEEATNWTPYIHAGVAVFRHNPFTIDKSGVKYFLRPLSTEGQGLPEYPDRQQYSLVDFAFPLGGGVRVAINDRITIGYEVNIRKTFTDYLDDVSGNYPDENILRNRKGNKAVELSYRGGEISGGIATYPAANTPRGSAKNRDWFSTQMFTMGFKLKSDDGGFLGSYNKYKMGCPSY